MQELNGSEYVCVWVRVCYYFALRGRWIWFACALLGLTFMHVSFAPEFWPWMMYMLYINRRFSLKGSIHQTLFSHRISQLLWWRHKLGHCLTYNILVQIVYASTLCRFHRNQSIYRKSWFNLPFSSSFFMLRIYICHFHHYYYHIVFDGRFARVFLLSSSAFLAAA